MSILVFHLTPRIPDDYIRVDRNSAKSLWREPAYASGYYRLVAIVESDDLEVAFEKTNHIDESWTKNPEVQAIPGAFSFRSTSVGDVALLNGKLYLCESVGWTEIL